jgi:FlaA1/EpsC-like NDP-sugar epimerase
MIATNLVQQVAWQLRRLHQRLPLPYGARLFGLGWFYTIILFVCYTFAYLLRFDFDVTAIDSDQFVRGMVWIVPLKFICLVAGRVLRSQVWFFGVSAVPRLVFWLTPPSAAMLAVRLVTGSTTYAPPIGVTLIDFMLCVGLISTARLGLRFMRQFALDAEALDATGGRAGHLTRIAIIGAGEAGGMFAQDVLLKSRFRMKPVAFLDDAQSKWRVDIHGIPVLGAPELLKDGGYARYGIEEVIIAMPSVGARRLREIVSLLEAENLPFRTIPSMDQLAKGTVQVSQIRPVEIEDLLGRDPVRIDTVNIRKLICGHVVMVTGAGGSIGGELCRQLASHAPARILLVEQSEVQLFQIEQELISEGFAGVIVPLIADITDERRMRQVFSTYHPVLVFHAAAHKHVPMMEGQPGEAIKNNSLGSALVASLAAEYGVERFILISTDKAINPVNVMGATKRLAELAILTANEEARGTTRYMAVRFGNVLGSSGSVIPQFKSQIAAGGPVKVTCPEITRYFMTIPEAVGLVLQCATLGQGGEIFVLDMGKPVRIVDLARQLIKLSGFKPDEDIAIEFSGLRPGEKCFEELSYHRENYSPTPHPSIMRFCGPAPASESVLKHLTHFRTAVHEAGARELKRLLQEAVPEYTPRGGVAGGEAPSTAPQANFTCDYFHQPPRGSANQPPQPASACPCLQRGLNYAYANSKDHPSHP